MKLAGTLEIYIGVWCQSQAQEGKRPEEWGCSQAPAACLGWDWLTKDAFPPWIHSCDPPNLSVASGPISKPLSGGLSPGHSAVEIETEMGPSNLAQASLGLHEVQTGAPRSVSL